VTTLLLKHTGTQMTTPMQMNSRVMAKAAKSPCIHKTQYFEGKYEIVKKWQLEAADIV
jgi:hypothetical protein